MKAWTTEAFVDDIKAASDLARAESGHARLYVAGFSRGVFLAYAYACAEPSAVMGVIALDGQFKSHAPKAEYEPAADLQKLESTGAWATDVSGRLGWEGRQRLMLATAENPSAPSTDPRYKTLGEQLSNLLQFAWGPGALANPLGGQSRPEVLARLLFGYDRYYPAVQDPEGKRMGDRSDDPATAVDDLWGEMKTPILYFGNARMPGDWLLNGIYSAQKSGSPDVTINVLEGYGHLDVLVGDHARREVFEPALAWIRSHADRR
jgi:pimeloyl-ACP methyl ester carboxylesterase